MKIWRPRSQEARGDHIVTVSWLVRFVTIAAVVAIAIIAIREASRTDETAHTIAPTTTARDPLAAQLARCREITAEQLAVDASCRRVWAENRKRFFMPNAPVTPTTNAPSKAQDRIPTSPSPLSPEETR